jgi:hypothetical protein
MLTPWPESASELYRPSDSRLTAKLVPTFADRRCHVVTVTNPYGRILGFLDRSSYFFFQVAPQYRRCHVVTVTNPYGRILGFLDRSSYFFFQVAPQLYSRD